MKIKVVIVILAIAAVGFFIAWQAAKKQSAAQHMADVNSIADFSNQVVNATTKVNDLSQRNLDLANDLSASRQESLAFSNQLNHTSLKLNNTSLTLASTKNDLNAARGQINDINNRIAGLEQQNKSLEQRSSALSNNIVMLNQQIASTRQKLSHSHSVNTFLQQELQRQMAARAELEHKLTDLTALREQVRKIKKELFVARRLRFMHNSHAGQKGAELLMHPLRPSPPPSAAQKMAASDLNVEIGSDGSVKVIPPLGAKTGTNASTVSQFKDNPAQAKARMALEKELQQLNSHSATSSH